MATTITPEPVGDGARRRTNASTKLLHEWISIVHSGVPVYYELRLGSTVMHAPGLQLPPNLEAMLRVHNRYADAIVVTKTEILVVECTVVADDGSISQLYIYNLLAPATPELAKYAGRAFQAVNLVAVDDEMFHRAANAWGQRVEVFPRPWVEEYLTAKHFRRRFGNPSGS